MTTSYDWQNALRILGLQDGKQDAFISAQLDAARAVDPAWGHAQSVKVIALLMAASRQAQAADNADAAAALRRSAEQIEDRLDYTAKQRAAYHADQAMAAIHDSVRKEIGQLVNEAHAKLKATNPSIRALSLTGTFVVSLAFLIAGMLLNRLGMSASMPLPTPDALLYVALGAAGTLGLWWIVYKIVGA